jgi:hypothetical protein
LRNHERGRNEKQFIFLLAIKFNVFPRTNISGCQLEEKIENQEKSVENLQNQLLNSGDFRSGETQKNQETPDQFRRFGNPGYITNLPSDVKRPYHTST